MPYFYISHGTEDYEIAKKLADNLLKLGYNVWQVTEQEKMTSVWHEGMDDSLAVVVLMSPQTLKNKPAEEERKFIAKLRKPIIPVLVSGMVFTEYRSLPHVDMQKADVAENALVAFLRMHATPATGQGQVIKPDGQDGDETETKPAADLTAMAKPKQLQDLMKALRDGIASQPKPPSDTEPHPNNSTKKLG